MKLVDCGEISCCEPADVFACASQALRNLARQIAAAGIVAHHLVHHALASMSPMLSSTARREGPQLATPRLSEARLYGSTSSQVGCVNSTTLCWSLSKRMNIRQSAPRPSRH